VGAGALGLGLIVQGMSSSFVMFLLGATLQAPASGVFVNLAQASLMDDAPTRRENRMALWTFSGSAAVVVGPLLLTAAIALGSGWRPVFVGTGTGALLVALWIALLPANRALRSSTSEETPDESAIGQRIAGVLRLLRSRAVWRWLVLLQCSDLMLDVLFGLLALYMVDVVGVDEAKAALAIVVWAGVGLLGDFLLIPLLERVNGVRYLRFSVWVACVLYPAFLLLPWFPVKLLLLALMGLFNAGWYAILQGRLYDTLGEQSGAVLIVGNAAGVFGALLPVMLGALAGWFGLGAAMWFLLVGPLALLVGLPRR